MQTNIEKCAKKYAILLFFFSIPAKPFEASWAPGIGEILALVYIIIVTTKNYTKFKKWTISPVLIATIGLTPSILIATSIPTAIGNYLQIVGYIFIGVTISALFISELTNNNDKQQSCFLAACMCLAHYGKLISVALIIQISTLKLFSFDILFLFSASDISSESFAFGGTPRLTSIFPHSIHLGIALMLPLYACVAILRNGKGSKIYTLILVIILIGIIFSGSRGALILTLPALILLLKPSIKYIIFTLIFSVGFTPIAIYLGKDHLTRAIETVTLSSDGDEAMSNLQRIYLWRFAAEGLTEKPIFGHGLGHYKALSSENNDYMLKEYGIGEDNLTQYAGIAYETGLVGFIAIMYLLFKPISTFVLTKRIGLPEWFIHMGFVTLLINNAFQNNLFTRGTWTITWFTYGILLYFYTKRFFPIKIRNNTR